MKTRSLIIVGVVAIASCGTAAPPGNFGETEVSSSESSTTDSPQCPAVPQVDCSVPYDGTGWGCGDTPRSDFDENCCYRPTCASDAECTDGLVCSPTAMGVTCYDEIEDGDTVCRCSADPTPQQLRSICVPPSAVSSDWCRHHGAQTPCDTATPLARGEGIVEVCRWIETYDLLDDGSSCAAEPSYPQCVTIREGADAGCGAATCTAPGGSIELNAPWVSDGFEVLDAAILCDVGAPTEPWVPAADADLGACAFTCE